MVGFAHFGGLDLSFDTSKPLEQLIESEILERYAALHGRIAEITLSDPVYHKLLSAAALGDGRIHSVLRRSEISESMANPAIRYLCNNDMLYRQPSFELEGQDADLLSDRLRFVSPWMRFWFAFVSPIFRGIQEGDYREFRERYTNRSEMFVERVFEDLSTALIASAFTEDPVVRGGSFWNLQVQIDQLGVRRSGAMVAGLCRFGNSKMKKSELNRLQQQCEAVGLKADTFVLISRAGFSSELKALKGETLRLFTIKSFKTLLNQ